MSKTALAAVMTVLAMGLGYAIAIGDPTSLSANLQVVARGLQISGTTTTFVDSLATLTMAATVLSAGALGDLYGAVSAVKSAVNEGGYSLGPALFALVGINLFLTDSARELSRSGITRSEAREAVMMAHGGRTAHLVNPEQARLVIDQAPHTAVDAIHTLTLIMAVGPIAAIILALWLIKPVEAGQ